MKNLNKVISGVLISSLLFTPVSTLALTKEETVYTNLNYDGTVEKTIVNNHISDLDKGKVTDDTELKKAEAKYEADMRKINAKDKKFDTDLAALEQERNAIKTEMDTLKTVAKDNVDRTFKLFS